jgi:hypothetical protein
MERFILEIGTLNAAFGDSPYDKALEVARILRKAADTLDDGLTAMSLRDNQGNRVGFAEFTGEEG